MIELANALFDYEKQLQRLFAGGGRLVSALVAAQAGQNLSPVAGHQVLSAVSEAQLAVSGAIRHMAEGHRQLEVMALKFGFDPEAYGDVLKQPAAQDRSPVRIAA